MSKRNNKGEMKKRAAMLLVMCVAMIMMLCVPVFAETELEGTVKVDNGIPVVYLNIDESRGTIYDMIDSVDHSVYCYGTISIVVPEGFHYSDFPDNICETLEDLEMSIRGRGNSTWERSAKKPFKIKLEKKADIFGLGENKHWVLLANAFDETLVRDRLTAWLGDELGFDFTPRGVPVDLVIIGEEHGTEYLGSYYLSENVRVDKNRLEIDELKEDDTDPDVITGGYLIQNSFQVDKGSPDRFKTSRGAEWATHTPSFDTEEVSLGRDLLDSDGQENFTGTDLGDGYKNSAQQEYIQNYVQHFEDVLYEQGTAYRDLMDLESAVKYWLIQEFSLNGDAYATGSTYFYKVRDTENGPGKIYWGPLWDFDFAWDHQMIREELAYGHEWIKPMMYDRAAGGFIDEIHKQWPLMKDALIRLTEDGGVIDQYREETRASAEQDRKIRFPDAEDMMSYDEDIDELKDWIIERMNWVDANIGIVDNMIHKVTYVVDGEPYLTKFFSFEEYIEGDEAYPEKEGYVFVGWEDEEGNIVKDKIYVTEDMTFTARYLSDKEATHGKDIAFSKNSDVMKYNVHIYMYQIPYTVIPEDALDRVVEWSSSNEEWATVDEEGMVTFNGSGSATFTAKLRFGETRQFTLTVTDGDLPIPTSVYPDKEEIKITTGEQSVLSISTVPNPAKIDSYEYEVEDESVVTIGENGVLTALAPGKTTVKVIAITYGNEGEETVNETKTVVKVSDERPGWISYIPYAATACVLIITVVSIFAVRAVRKKNN